MIVSSSFAARTIVARRSIAGVERPNSYTMTSNVQRSPRWLQNTFSTSKGGRLEPLGDGRPLLGIITLHKQLSALIQKIVNFRHLNIARRIRPYSQRAEVRLAS